MNQLNKFFSCVSARPWLMALVVALMRLNLSAAVPEHWAYSAPTRSPLPSINLSSWPRTPVDFFILAPIEAAGVEPSPEADRPLLLRRLYLDLIGLPPSPVAVDSFLADLSPEAYVRVVDELLASPQYGERWARLWLDLARYADSNGFQRDGFRDLWAYRDWVIAALNNDMPFDQFTIAQLAGDLLPDATDADRVATGFHRCTTVNVEAGTDQEENRVNQVVDRINTTATVWMGTTLQCAQCHDHKHDPFSQRDYYRLFAYFNNTEIETQFRTAKATAAIDFSGPTLALPPWEDPVAQRRLLEEIAHLEAQSEDKNAVKAQLERLRAQLAQLTAPTTLVMRERVEPRTTAILDRGSFLHPKEPVTAGVPAVLHSAPIGPPNRLTLARWLVSSANPLVARVTVNRWWTELFGRGLVLTPEDFGTQGARPTHPELLDWLAVEFMEHGWSMKHVHRLIVLSAFYRQSSVVSPTLAERDPANILHARGARFRLEAERIRDNALAAAGLLTLKQGGPPVRPPQPEGIWRVTGLVDNTYLPSAGQDGYRLGIYTVWRRSAPYPSFVNFDAPTRTDCVVKRSRSNTPLQALTLLNDPVYVEAAWALAGRILTAQPEATAEDQLLFAFRVCLARRPQPDELSLLQELLENELRRLQDRPGLVSERVGQYPVPRGVSPQQLAAWYPVAVVLLNLNEMITKG